jgi:hypothetical protein
MTEYAKDRLIDLGIVVATNIGAYVYTKYFILPETGMMYKEDGEWITSQTVFPYASDLGFTEWPTPIQQGFLTFMFGTVLSFFIVLPILYLILDFIVDRIKRLF